ncbi:LysM peptidoglycan-binding domain-containing protein [Streptomyces sp. NPDC059582]|uniref:LysM peptidoglycan-binding domain-containing protein n=1 Tax=Streptomyces sp. NPDC059582 TaxID=3346875 RepID=UPI00367E9074
MFDPTSRYHGIATTTLTTPDGRTVTYVRRRFLPQPEDLMSVGTQVVEPGDRLDRIAARQYGAPEQAWRIADANGAIRPEDLTSVPGRRLRIALPAGVPGSLPMAMNPAPS